MFASYQKRIESIHQQIADMKGTDVNSFEVRKLVGEYDFVAKQLYQVKDPKELLIDLAREYRTNIELANGVDCIYGTGSAKYIGEAIEAFYIS